jgi:hypothetical protein
MGLLGEKRVACMASERPAINCNFGAPGCCSQDAVAAAAAGCPAPEELGEQPYDGAPLPGASPAPEREGGAAAEAATVPIAMPEEVALREDPIVDSADDQAISCGLGAGSGGVWAPLSIT